MSWLTEIARPEIQALRAYEHAVWEPGLIRLHANELPWRSPGDSSAAGLNRYPEPHPHELTAALARFYGVDPAGVLASRGSDEGIDLLIRCYCRAGRDAVIVCPPTFGMYSVAARVQGAAVVEVPLRRDLGFAADLDALRARADELGERARIVFLCSPNNPTGNRLDAQVIRTLARYLQGRALLVVDEAYVEFAGQPSLIAALREFPGLVVLRTLSKAYALAGARCGVLLAHPDVVALLRKVIQPYAVTQLTIEAVMRALEPAALAETGARIREILTQRARLAQALAGMRGIRRVWPSDANFLLVECTDAADLLARTHAAGVLVRDLRGAPQLEQAVRISVGTPEQNDRLLASLA